MHTVFTSESVSAGHPDKMADKISDSILDAILTLDPNAKTGIETALTSNRIILMGEVSSSAQVDYAAVAREVVQGLGYTHPEWGFSDQAQVQVYINQQSSEIAQGVDDGGAGDQGMMFGYACRETPEYMPMPIMLAHALARGIDEAQARFNYLRPDGKAQVTVKYENDQPVGIQHVTIAKPHNESVSLSQVKTELFQEVVRPVFDHFELEVSPDIFVLNGTGTWHHPGPASDAGLTGRKIIVDTYGGYARVGGGAFSGKDATKVDRSGAYAARYIAKNLVAANLADRVEVGLAYFIGAKVPVMKHIDTFGTAKASTDEINAFTQALIDTSVTGIIRALDLKRPIYAQTASYGHFGRSEFPWEKILARV